MFGDNLGTFYPNPNENTEPWIEHKAFDKLHFRIWHVILIGMIAFVAFVRIPRTKQEIEADFRRKRLTEKFRQRLKLIKNQDMDALDLKAALEMIQEDYKSETRNVEECSVRSYPLYTVENENAAYYACMQAAPQTTTPRNL